MVDSIATKKMVTVSCPLDSERDEEKKINHIL